MTTEYPPGWSCEVVVLRFERYILGTLNRGEALAIAEHLEACIVCAEQLAVWKPRGAARRV